MCLLERNHPAFTRDAKEYLGSLRGKDRISGAVRERESDNEKNKDKRVDHPVDDDFKDDD